MRSHAKASPAGSNSGRGESRRSLRRPGALAALLVALMAAACLLPGSASAIEFRSLTSSFGPDGTEGTSFSEYLGPLAFDQSSKHLLALDQEEQEIHGFDASTPGSHPPLGGSYPLSAPGASEIDGIAVDSSSHAIYFASYGGEKLYGFAENGTALPGFPKTGFEELCGVAVDPAGNVWAADYQHKVYEYSSAGVQLALVFLPSVNPCGIAVDSDENLYLANYFGSTVKYTAASGYETPQSTVVDSGVTYAIALDHSTNELYVVHEKKVSVFDESGALVYEFGNVAGTNYYGEFGGIAIDEASEEVYVSDAGHGKVRVFGPPASLPKTTTEGADAIAAAEATVHGTVNPRGLAVEDCHFEVISAKQFIETKYENVTAAQKFPCEPAAGSIPVDANPHAVSAGVTGLKPATVYHYRLAAKNSIGEGHGTDRQFTTSAAAPLVEEQSVETVGTTDATLAAKINPRGTATTYHVEYGTTNAYGQSSGESAPFGFANDSSLHNVSVHIGGLQPGSAYHFRFVATNSVAPTAGADASFATYPATAPLAPCPDERFRTGPGSRLPDCRAYEQATPIDKHGANAQGTVGVGVSSSGDRVTFFTNGGLPSTGGSSALAPFLASRGPGGWSTDGVLPPTSPGVKGGVFGGDGDLTATLAREEDSVNGGSTVYLRDNLTGAFQFVAADPSATVFQSGGFSADPANLLFRTNGQLLPSAPAGKENLYEFDHGALTLVDRVPAGAATSCDDETGPACVVPPQGVEQAGSPHFSRGGSKAFFTVNGTGQPFGTGRIYLREDGARTTWISASQRTVPDPGGEKPATLLNVTPDGSQVLFMSCEKLTDDSTAFSTGENRCDHNLVGEPNDQGQDLYSYDVASGELTDLTVDSSVGDPRGAEVQGLLGVSEDGSYVYFLANGTLAPGASRGDCKSSEGFLQDCNLYVYHDGATTFIARLPKESQAAGVSADGSTLIIGTIRSLTGYNNHGTAGTCGNIGEPCTEFFRYNAPEEELLCVTCRPTGLPPSEAPELGGQTPGGFLALGTAGGARRNVSADGNRFFFQTVDALVPADTNGVRDAYEWEAKGEGSCESESQDGGCLYLISSGTDPQPSTFLGASKDGDHAFFFTEQQLVPGDQDHLVDVYDAGVGSGLAAQHELSPPTCASTACQANPAPPPDPSLASAAYAGAGNVHKGAAPRRCPQGKHKVRSGGKVRCQKAHKQHKRHKRANTNRGGSK